MQKPSGLLSVPGKAAEHNDSILSRVRRDTPEAAAELRGTVVYIDRDDAHLPEGVYFVQDIIGLTAVDTDDGRIYGEVTDVFKTGANDVYQITADGKNYLIPKIPEVVEKIDTDEGKLYINTKIIGGLFEDEN